MCSMLHPSVGLMACVAAAQGLAAQTTVPEPLRLPSGDPVCAIYFFTHWWEPWKSDDDAILRDLAHLKAMGINTLLLDHEWSQAIDGDWRLLDRGHHLAKQAGMQILPWLSLKTWSDMGSHASRVEKIREDYGVELRFSKAQDGTDSSVMVHDDATIEAGTRYATEYIERYLEDGALARFVVDGRSRPCVALTVELAWSGGGFDDDSIALFREWASERYGANITELNRAWGTRLASFDAIDPTDASVFDYDGLISRETEHAQAVEDHVEFRSQMVDRGLTAVKERLLQRYPDLLIATELPYQLASEHPHARGYRISYGANPSASYHADVLFLRMTGPLNDVEREALGAHIARTGQRVVLCHRTYGDWGTGDVGAAARRYGEEPASCANGIGFYSWNEMVDVHVAAPGEGSPINEMTVDGDRATRMQGLLRHILRAYLNAAEGR